MTAQPYGGATEPQGELRLRVVRNTETRARPGRELSLRDIVAYGTPSRDLHPEVNRFRKANAPHLGRGVRRFVPARFVARRLGLPYMWSQLWLRKIAADGQTFDYGLAGLRVVTDAGVAAIVDGFQNTVEIETFNYHGFGTGSTAEAAGDTALVTELTTQYTVDNTRPTGTQGEGATANIYQTVGTLTVDSGGPLSMREHGIFTQAATGGGTLLDRTVYALITLETNDSLEATYEITFTAGS